MVMTIYPIYHQKEKLPSSLVHSCTPGPHSSEPHGVSERQALPFPICQPSTPQFLRHISNIQSLTRQHWRRSLHSSLNRSNNPTYLVDVTAGPKAPRHFTARTGFRGLTVHTLIPIYNFIFIYLPFVISAERKDSLRARIM